MNLGPFAVDAPFALALVVLTVLVVMLRFRSAARGRPRAMLVFGGAAATLAFLAAAGLSWRHLDDRLTVVMAVDRSRSMRLVANVDARVSALEHQAAAHMRRDDRIARIGFGASASTEMMPRLRNAPEPAAHDHTPSDDTNFAAAIEHAMTEVSPDSAGRIVLVTDGAPSRGEALQAASRAASQGVAIDVVRLPRTGAANVRVDALRLPSASDEHETFDLRVVTHATQETPVTLVLRIDGAEAQRARTTLRAGEDVLTLAQVAPTPGLHRYEVEVVSDSVHDTIVEDNRAGRFLRVRGASSALLLEGDPGASAPLANTLRAGGFRVVEGSASSVPDSLAAMASYDLIILSDVPARAMSPAQLDALRKYVRDLGGGLLLMGGDRAFGPGGYARTPIEEIAPVRFDLRQERRRATLAEVIAIDYSGSMAAQVGGFTKLQLADEAAIRSASLLSREDRLGVAHVDTVTAWTVRLAPLTNMEDVARRMRNVSMGGGGIIVPIALRDAYGVLRHEQTNLRHLLLFADGADAEEMDGCDATVAQAYREGITTSVVSLGQGSDTPGLERLAREGHGRFYLVEDALRLPTVFAQETVLATRAAIREEVFRPTVTAPDAVVGNIDFGRGPPLRGYTVTIAKPRATVVLRGPEDDPVLALWQLGIGNVAVFTSDAKDRWGAAWIAWPDAQRMFVSLARRLARHDDGLVRAEAEVAGGALRVQAYATGRDGRADAMRTLSALLTAPDGHMETVSLDPIGAGSYVASHPLATTGHWSVTVRDDTLGAVVATTGAIANAGEEFRAPVDEALLREIAALTGGRVLTDAHDVFAHRPSRRRGTSPLAPWLMGASLVCLFASVMARRLALPERLARRFAPVRPATVTRVAKPRLAATVSAKTKAVPAPLVRAPQCPSAGAEPVGVLAALATHQERTAARPRPTPRVTKPAAPPAPRPPAAPGARSLSDVLAARRKRPSDQPP